MNGKGEPLALRIRMPDGFVVKQTFDNNISVIDLFDFIFAKILENNNKMFKVKKPNGDLLVKDNRKLTSQGVCDSDSLSVFY